MIQAPKLRRVGIMIDSIALGHASLSEHTVILVSMLPERPY